MNIIIIFFLIQLIFSVKPKREFKNQVNAATLTGFDPCNACRHVYTKIIELKHLKKNISFIRDYIAKSCSVLAPDLKKLCSLLDAEWLSDLYLFVDSDEEYEKACYNISFCPYIVGKQTPFLKKLNYPKDPENFSNILTLRQDVKCEVCQIIIDFHYQHFSAPDLAALPPYKKCQLIPQFRSQCTFLSDQRISEALLKRKKSPSIGFCRKIKQCQKKDKVSQENLSIFL